LCPGHGLGLDLGHNHGLDLDLGLNHGLDLDLGCDHGLGLDHWSLVMVKVMVEIMMMCIC